MIRTFIHHPVILMTPENYSLQSSLTPVVPSIPQRSVSLVCRLVLMQRPLENVVVNR